LAIVDALDTREPKVFVDRLKQLTAQPPDLKSRERLSHWLEALAGRELAVAEEASDVYTVVYERSNDHDRELIVHAVRYAAPLGNGEELETKPAPLKLSIPAAADWSVSTAEVLRPGEPAVQLKVHSDGKMLRCELPPFAFYSMLHLKLADNAKSF
jgi:hypothetical protein